jgi:hypothetical protein
LFALKEFEKMKTRLIGDTREQEIISCLYKFQNDLKGAIDMSIDRFIIKKLDSCHEEHTRQNLVKLFRLRIQKAEKAEQKNYKIS